MLNSPEITVEVTNMCNAACIMCPRDSFTQKPRHMDMELFKKIIDQAIDDGYVSLDTCGFGDPLLDPFLEHRLEYVRTKYPFIRMYSSTTCNQLTPDKFDWFCKSIDTLKVSIFGMSMETYERVHKNLSYKKSIENILMFIEFIKNRKKPYMIGLLLLLPENQHEMQAWIDFWESKLDEVMVWKPHNWAGARDYRKKSYERKSCGRPMNGNLTVNADGRVSICCFDYNKQQIIGDMNSQSLREIRTQSSELKKICDMHKILDFDDRDYICKNCDQTFTEYENVLIYSSNKDRHPHSVTSHKDITLDFYTTQNEQELIIE